MQDAGLKEVCSTLYKENSLSSKNVRRKSLQSLLEGVFAHRYCFALTLLSGNDHSQENEENQIFEPIQTFDNNEDVVNFCWRWKYIWLFG